MTQDNTPLSHIEHIKQASNYLRGSIPESLRDLVTGAVSEDDAQITKYYGIYQQDDRDLRAERQHQKLEPHFQFMLRLRIPGGVVTPAQWLALSDCAHRFANGTLRITTRQTLQFHGILKRHLKPLMQAISALGLDSRGACGDVNRNVIISANPHESAAHTELHRWAVRISEHLAWRSRAYEDIWLDAEPRSSGHDAAGEIEPIYGNTYLPRKFKIALAIPPCNDVDLFANDLGFIAIVESGAITGFNVSVGGGLGTTHKEPDTYPRLGSVIGYAPISRVMEVAEQTVRIQRDHGDRRNRKHARFKYTLDDRGLDWFMEELHERMGWRLEPTRPHRFESSGDRHGWTVGDNGHHHLTLHIENGRVGDSEDLALDTALRELAEAHDGEFRLTCNQNLIVANVTPARRHAIQAVIDRHRLIDPGQTPLRRAAMACVALPTCGLAMAEAERYLPSLIGKLDALMQDAGLGDDPILVRMTGCPNGCARPYLGEIGFIGKAPGRYNLYLGASFNGDRLNKLYRENISEPEILDILAPMIRHYADRREPGERFGDFVIRAGIVQPTLEGRLFHHDTGPGPRTGE